MGISSRAILRKKIVNKAVIRDNRIHLPIFARQQGQLVSRFSSRRVFSQ